MVGTIGQFLLTVTVGLFESGLEYNNALEQGGFGIGQQARYLLLQPDFILSPKPTQLELILVTGAELGFQDRPSYEEICERALSLGLALCPAEVGPVLRLTRQNQEEEVMLIGMELILGWVFDVSREFDGYRLTISQCKDTTFPISIPWVFVRPRPQE